MLYSKDAAERLERGKTLMRFRRNCLFFPWKKTVTELLNAFFSPYFKKVPFLAPLNAKKEDFFRLPFCDKNEEKIFCQPLLRRVDYPSRKVNAFTRSLKYVGHKRRMRRFLKHSSLVSGFACHPSLPSFFPAQVLCLLLFSSPSFCLALESD